MKIIVVGPNFDNYKSASYQNEFMNALKKISQNYFHYGEDKELNIDDLCKQAKFIPDIIFYNHGWLLDDPNLKKIRYSNIKNHLFYKEIKHILFLNKEYSRIEEKYNEIKKYKFDLIFTHLHNLECDYFNSIKPIFLPLACSYESTSKYSKRKLKDRKYDLFFSGILQNWNFRELQNDLRKKIQDELFYCIFDFPILKKLKYRDLNIFWKPFYKNRIKNLLSNLLHSERLSQKDYFNTLANSKCVLHTDYPIGIISTRIFEALGSGSIGLFSNSSNADIIFRDNRDFISFNSIKDLVSKVYQIKYSKNKSRFQRVADFGRMNVEKKHTWKNRVELFKNKVKKIK